MIVKLQEYLIANLEAKCAAVFRRYDNATPFGNSNCYRLHGNLSISCHDTLSLADYQEDTISDCGYPTIKTRIWRHLADEKEEWLWSSGAKR
jgi:hypothetical protein